MPISKLRPSFTLTEDRLKELQAVVPEAFADGRINWDALREALGESLEDESQEHFGLFWPGKREARRLAALPSKGTLIPQPGAGVDEDNTHNLFIEGDNLEVLKLLQKSYAGRVKMIYIDPPYNTGNDFVYPDNFADPLDTYLQITGQKDSSGNLLTSNAETSGRYHSDWLSMMYPRLLLARQLLRMDGVILVSIDDNEMFNLRLLLNEIFGEEGYLSTFVWRRRIGSSMATSWVSSDHEYVVAYSRDPDAVYVRGDERDMTKYSIPDGKGRFYASMPLTVGMTKAMRPNQWYELKNPKTGTGYWPPEGRVWGYYPPTMEQKIQENKIIWPEDFPDRKLTTPRLKTYPEDAKRDRKPISTWITEKNSKEEADQDSYSIASAKNEEGTRILKGLLGDSSFSYPKPLSLIKGLVEQFTRDNDLVLDFFAGSATTAHAVIEQNQEDGNNRSFIMVQLPERTDNPKFPTISAIGRQRIKSVVKNMKSEKRGKLQLDREQDMGFKSFALDHSNYSDWQLVTDKNISQLELRFEKAETPLVESWKSEDLLAEILLLQGFPLDSKVNSLPEFKANAVQQVTSEFVTHPLFVCLDKKIKPETVSKLKLGSEDIFVCLDSALSDEAKVKLADQCNLKVI